MADSDILRGAMDAAAGKQLGLSVDDVIQLKRLQQRQERADRSSREGNRTQAEEFLASDDRSYQSVGRYAPEDAYPDPFGEDQSLEQTFTTDERAERGLLERDTGYNRELAKARGIYVNVPTPEGKKRYWREEGQLYGGPDKVRYRSPDYADDFTKPTGRDYLTDAEKRADAVNTYQEGRRTARENLTSLSEESRNRKARRILSNSIDVDRARSDADLKVSQEAIEALGARLGGGTNLAAVLRNEADAYFEASVIKNRLGGVPRQMAERDIGRINEVQMLGPSIPKFNKGVNPDLFRVVQGVDPSTMDNATQMVGPDGRTVGYVNDAGQWLSEVNGTSTANTLNAPQSRVATWMEAHLPNAGREGGTNYGWPEVVIGDELGQLNSRLAGAGINAGQGVRGIDDLESLVDGVVGQSRESGKPLFNYDPEQRKQVPVADPGVDELLYKLRYTSPEKTRLANALLQMGAAQKSPVNQQAKEMYAAAIPSEVSSDVIRGADDQVKLQRMDRESVGRGKNKSEIKPLLARLNASPEEVLAGRPESEIYTADENGRRVMLPNAARDLSEAREGLSDAQQPFMASPRGQKPEQARFVSAKARGMSPQQRIDEYGAEKGGIANEVERRFNEAEAKKAAAPAPDMFAKELNSRSAEFKKKGESIERQRVIDDLLQVGRDQGKPRGRGQMILGGQMVPNSAPDGMNYNLVPETISDTPMTPRVVAKPSQATSAMANPATESTPLEVRGGWMGGGGSGDIVDPWSSSSSPSAPESTTGVRGELATINPGPVPGPGPRSAPQGFMNRAAHAAKQIRGYAQTKNPRIRNMRRGGYAAGGAAAGIGGLSALISGEQEKRQEEAMY